MSKPKRSSRLPQGDRPEPEADAELLAAPPGTPPGTSPEDLLDGADDEVLPIVDELDEDGAEHLRFVLTKNAKHRLDKYLQNRLKRVSRNQIQRLIALGGVSVNGKTPKPSTSLRLGDIVDVILPPRPAKELIAEPIPIDIVYEDEAFLVVNKPANLIVHPARGQITGTLLNALAYHFAQQGVTPDPVPLDDEDADDDTPTTLVPGLSRVGAEDARPGIVHRLDRNTTGIIIVAKQDESHWMLARQFEHRTNLKAYLAVVHGCPPEPGGVVEQPIGKHPTIREAMAVRHDSTSKHAVTLYRVRERYQGYSLVELELKTGRTHQIRVHLSYLGCPIVGDIVYGGEPVGQRELDEPPLAAGARPNLNFARDKEEGARIEQAAAARADMLLATPALHAALLRITHPIRDEPMTFTAPVPSPMKDLVRELRQRPAPGPVAREGYWVDLDKILPRDE